MNFRFRAMLRGFIILTKSVCAASASLTPLNQQSPSLAVYRVKDAWLDKSILFMNCSLTFAHFDSLHGRKCKETIQAFSTRFYCRLIVFLKSRNTPVTSHDHVLSYRLLVVNHFLSKSHNAQSANGLPTNPACCITKEPHRHIFLRVSTFPMNI